MIIYKSCYSAVFLIHFVFLISLLFLSHSFSLKVKKPILVQIVNSESSSFSQNVSSISAERKANDSKVAPMMKVSNKDTTKVTSQASSQKSLSSKKRKKTAVFKRSSPKSGPKSPLQGKVEKVVEKIAHAPYPRGGIVLNVPRYLSDSPTLFSHLQDMGNEMSDRDKCLEAFFRSCLSLPELGEVKVQLKVARDGHVMQIKIVDADSSRNSDYLEKQLLHMKLPFALDQEETLTFTFCNEI